MSDFAQMLAQLAQALDRAGMPYMIIGGQAVLHHGEPRFTRDIDITLGAEVGALPQVLALLAELKLTPAVNAPSDFVRRTRVLPCAGLDSAMRVDVIFADSPYESHAIERAVCAVVAGQQVRFASVEDLIIHKLLAGRARDLEDALSVMCRNPTLDVADVRHWLGQFEQALDQPLIARFDALRAQARGQ